MFTRIFLYIPNFFFHLLTWCNGLFPLLHHNVTFAYNIAHSRRKRFLFIVVGAFSC